MRLEQDELGYALRCSYHDRGEAKRLGCQWDPVGKRWRVQGPGHARFLAQNSEISVSPEVAILAEPNLSEIHGCGHAIDGLYEHQRSGVSWLLAHPRSILADDMGLGKTRTALVAAYLARLPVLVIGPAAAQTAWEDELAVLEARGGAPDAAYASWAKVPDPKDLPAGPCVLVADEAHYAQSAKSQRTRRFLRLADDPRVQYCWLLTGTPIKNGRPSNLYPLLRALWHRLGWNRRWYEVTFCDAKPTKFTRWDVTGARNLDLLHREVDPIILRRKKSECLDLPPKLRILKKVTLESAAKRDFEEKYEKLRNRYRSGARLAAQVELGYLRQASSAGKVSAALELAQEGIEQGSRPVVFSAYRETAQRIAEELGAGLIWGGQSKGERQQAVHWFQDGDLPALSCTIGAGGVSLNLQASDLSILVDRPWAPGDALQAEDRIYRIGTQASVRCYWLQATRVDVAVDQVLIAKEKNIGEVLGGEDAVAEQALADLFQEG